MKLMKRGLALVLLLALTAVTAVSASAATPTAWRSCYTPYVFSFQLTEDSWNLISARWSSQDLADMAELDLGSRPYWEFEARVNNARYIWEEEEFSYFNLPNAYTEIDDDDVSIGTSRFLNVAANTDYYAVMHLMSAGLDSYPSTFTVESETGSWLGVDGLPVYYQQKANQPFDRRCSFNQSTTTPINSINGNAVMNASNDTSSVDSVKVIVDSSNQEMTTVADMMTTVGSLSQATLQEDAQLTFSEYLSVEELQELTADAVDVKEIYFWVPGETGRAIAKVEDGDVGAAIRRTVEHMKNTGRGVESLAATVEEFEKGNYGIFAAVVTGTLNSLNQLSESDMVTSAQLFRNPQAEQAARQANTEVSYISVPDKPDAAQEVY